MGLAAYFGVFLKTIAIIYLLKLFYTCRTSLCEDTIQKSSFATEDFLIYTTSKQLKCQTDAVTLSVLHVI